MPEAGTPPVSTPEEPAALKSTAEEPAADEPSAPSFEPAEPAPLGVVRTPTGQAGVDARLARLADADHLPADGHIEVYEDVHRGLREALTSLDARPAAVPGPVPTPPHPTASHDTQSHDTPSHRTHDTHHDHRS